MLEKEFILKVFLVLTGTQKEAIKSKAEVYETHQALCETELKHKAVP